MNADVVLVDGPACAEVFQEASRSGARLILSTERRRKMISGMGWKQSCRERISHKFVGGVTERVVDLSVFQPLGSPELRPSSELVQEVPRDASTVLSLKEYCKYFRPIPANEVVEPLTCVNLGTSERPYYHGRGLLPKTLTRDTWILTPFLFSPKAKREWGLRRLGVEETLACLDFPDDWAKWLTKSGVDRDFVEAQPAMACFVAGSTRWLAALFEHNGGGGSFSDSSFSDSSKFASSLKKDVTSDSILPHLLGSETGSFITPNDSILGSNKKAKHEGSPSICQSGSELFTSKLQKRRNRDRAECLEYENAIQAKKKLRLSACYSLPFPELQPTSKAELLVHTSDSLERNTESTPSTKNLVSGLALHPGNQVSTQQGTIVGSLSKSMKKRICKKKSKQRRAQALSLSSLVEGPITTTEDFGPKIDSRVSSFGLNVVDLFPVEEIESDKTEISEGSTASRNQKAAKSDDAEVPKHLWEKYLFDSNPKWNNDKERFRSACCLLKDAMLRFWKSLVRKSLTNWIDERHPKIQNESPSPSTLIRLMPDRGRGKVRWRRYNREKNAAGLLTSEFTGEATRRYTWQVGGLEAYTVWWKARMKASSWDLVPGIDAVARASNASWFEWEDGSRPFHWRWPEFYQKVIRDGVEVHFISKKPSFKRPQAENRNPGMMEKMKAKLDKVRKRRYIAPGFVSSLTSFFAVPKGSDDIRMVYDASVSGLNDSIWVPRFPLPTIRTHLRSVEEGTYMADLDIGEMFLNFVLHSDLRALCGVDLTKYGGTVKDFETVAWEVWQRAAMGLKPSPYQAVQGMMVAEELIKGDPKDPYNPFKWDAVRLNLPGSKIYNSSLPWVSKIRLGDNNIACDLVIFVDDLRVTGPTEYECWQAAQRAAQVINHLGLQDAPRKRRGASQAPGPWTGSILRTDLAGVFLMVAQDKWDKAKSQVEEVITMIHTDPNRLDRKRLEQVRGFLQYVTQTYSGMTPYIIGFHLTIDGWRDNRTKDGWRQKIGPKKLLGTISGDWAATEELMAMEEALEQKGESVASKPLFGSQDPPKFVTAVPRFIFDLLALRALMSGSEPPLKRVRCSKTATAIYSFVDASGRGFGSTFQVGKKVYFQYGQWPEQISETMSSNWRELANLVESLEVEVRDRGLSDTEIFLFTDNTTAEAAYWKGNSKSEKLFDLILRLRLLEMNSDLIIHVIHVAGTRMMAQGTDGISRGDKSMGVMRGIPMEDFCPLHESAFQRSLALKSWLTAATKSLDSVFLEPEDWFLRGQGFGNFIWSPAPAAADVVVEQLGKARHKRPSSLHLVVAPRLMTGYWRRHLTRECDFYFKIPAGSCSLWEKTQYEPVLIFVCLPFTVARPNFAIRQRLLEDFHRSLLKEGLWQGTGKRGGDLLCKLLVRARALCPL